ncbi:MAG TPA: aminotransferase class V-fold PLP-dependent enzyme [Candidatus Woesebacteria bacterium]|nr:aminotransferase class V-fold PLP-dependent enzyme [Candidatus Woesebacteria bacterium]
MFNPKQIRNDFPIFQHHTSLTYLDSAATSLKPISVINKIEEYYKMYSANIHRGIYQIAEKATEEYEETRKVLALFLNAKRPEEIIFTKNTTEAINLVASSLGLDIMNPEDEIVTTILEHHSNFVPWQQLSFKTGGVFKIIGINENYELGITNFSNVILSKAKNPVTIEQDPSSSTTPQDDIVNLKQIVTKKTKILALSYVSNTLGTINPVKEIIAEAKKINPEIITVVDAAQAIPHMKVDVQDLGCDFLAFSSHKMLGPTGVGVLWGRYELLLQMSPYQFGGDMIKQVKLEQTTFNDVPHKFEAGTPNIADVIGLKEAITYLQYYGFEAIRKHELRLKMYAVSELQKVFEDTITIYSPQVNERTAGIITFTLDGIHAHDIAQVLDEENIAIRAGHHCTMPLHSHLQIPASARASFYLYNDEEDVYKLVSGIKKVFTTFKK